MSDAMVLGIFLIVSFSIFLIAWYVDNLKFKIRNLEIDNRYWKKTSELNKKYLVDYQEKYLTEIRKNV
jgi:hypothetical protein